MYPVSFEADPVLEDRNRLTTFFRGLLAIPWQIVQYLYSIAASVAVLIAWFAIAFTGRYPEGLYNFNAGFLRMSTRVNGFYYLLTDAWPSFGGGEDPDYPVRTLIGPPKEEYSRAKVFFRILLLIPVFILLYVMGFILGVVSFIAWVVLLFTARLPAGLYKPMRIAAAYNAKALAYYFLLTEEFPPFWVEEEEEAPRFERSSPDHSLQTGPAGL